MSEHHKDCSSDGLDWWCVPDCLLRQDPEKRRRELLQDVTNDSYARSLQIVREHDVCVGIVEVETTEPMALPVSRVFDLEDSMEKRGVVIDDEKTKTGSEDKTCPKCGAKLEEPDKCPICGTEPFEKRD